MLKWLRPVLAVVFAASLYAELPPLVDRNAFFGEIKITAAQISPDGKYISFLKPYNGTRNIWVKKADEPFSAAKPMSAETKRPVSGYFWSRDSKYLLYAQDQFSIRAHFGGWKTHQLPAFGAPYLTAGIAKFTGGEPPRKPRTRSHAVKGFSPMLTNNSSTVSQGKRVPRLRSFAKQSPSVEESSPSW